LDGAVLVIRAWAVARFSVLGVLSAGMVRASVRKPMIGEPESKVTAEALHKLDGDSRPARSGGKFVVWEGKRDVSSARQRLESRILAQEKRKPKIGASTEPVRGRA
jgi:hypothetical protein